MSIEIIKDSDGVRVEGDHVAEIPEPGMKCPECGVMARWIQAEIVNPPYVDDLGFDEWVDMPAPRVVSWLLVLCGHRLSTQEWELKITTVVKWEAVRK